MIKKVIKISATWCAPCRFYAETFHKVKEMEQYKGIEFKEYDIENDEEGQLLAEKHLVRNVPTTLIMDENDNLIYKLIGNIKLNDLTDTLNNVINGSLE